MHSSVAVSEQIQHLVSFVTSLCNNKCSETNVRLSLYCLFIIYICLILSLFLEILKESILYSQNYDLFYTHMYILVFSIIYTVNIVAKTSLFLLAIHIFCVCSKLVTCEFACLQSLPGSQCGQICVVTVSAGCPPHQLHLPLKKCHYIC